MITDKSIIRNRLNTKYLTPSYFVKKKKNKTNEPCTLDLKALDNFYLYINILKSITYMGV